MSESASSAAPRRGPRSPAIDPPADAILPPRHPDAPAPGEQIGSHYAECFGCGEDHPTGLHLHVLAGEGLTLTATFEVTRDHQGAPGLAHGGLLSCAFDEALGALNWLLLMPAVTGRLETDFRRPVPVGSVLHVRAAIVGVSGRKIFARAVGHLDGPEGPLAVTAAALFLAVPMQHFRSHGRAEDVDRAISEGRVGRVREDFEVNP